MWATYLKNGSVIVSDHQPDARHRQPETSPDPSAPPNKRRRKLQGLVSSRRRRWVAAGALACAVAGVSAGLTISTTAASSSAATTVESHPASGTAHPGTQAASGAPNARSGPAAGGASGTVSDLSPSGFTLTTSAGQKVNVEKATSTQYLAGTTTTSPSAVNNGDDVLVLGTTSGTSIQATQVIVNYQPATAATGSQVVPFNRGTPTTSKQVGQIPTSYTEGSGTIVNGTAATKSTEAALAAYPGGVVDRVVQLSNGEYEVHYIGVNWPHHVFVNQNFQVVGAD
jgi:hypothetical protein